MEYDEKLNSTSGQVTYNKSRKKHTNQTPRERCVAKAVTEIYSNLKDVEHDDSNLKAAICLAKRCCEQVIKRKESNEINVEVYERQLFLMWEMFFLIGLLTFVELWRLPCRVRCLRHNAKFSTNSGLHINSRKF